jgi:AcrB/AcrD/AcrF family
MGISIRAYARHHGVSDAAVRKAIKAGRITREADGTVDAAHADARWVRRTDPAQQRAPTREKAGSLETINPHVGALLVTFLKMVNANIPFWTNGWTTTLNVYAQIGLDTLVGLTPKNRILSIQFANRRRERGRLRIDSVHEAVITCLRRVLITSVPTVAGHSPLTLVSRAAAAARNLISLVVIGGMAIGMIFTLCVIVDLLLLAKVHWADKPTPATRTRTSVVTQPLRQRLAQEICPNLNVYNRTIRSARIALAGRNRNDRWTGNDVVSQTAHCGHFHDKCLANGYRPIMGLRQLFASCGTQRQGIFSTHRFPTP